MTTGQRTQRKYWSKTVTVTVDVDLDDLDLELSDVLSAEAIAAIYALRDFAEHRLDCSHHSMRWCDCGMAAALRAFDKELR